MSDCVSICHNNEHGDPINVAYSYNNNGIGLYVWEDDDGCSTEIWLTIDQTKHLVELINEGLRTLKKGITQ